MWFRKSRAERLALTDAEKQAIREGAVPRCQICGGFHGGTSKQDDVPSTIACPFVSSITFYETGRFQSIVFHPNCARLADDVVYDDDVREEAPSADA